MFNGGDDELERAWHERAARPKKTLTHLARQLEDASLESKAADLIADDDVRALGKRHVTRVAADGRDDAFEPIGFGNLPCHPDDATLFNRVDARRTRTTRQQTEDPRPRGEIDDDITARYDLADGAIVGRQAMAIAEVASVFVDYPRHEATLAEATEAAGASTSGCRPTA